MTSSLSLGYTAAATSWKAPANERANASNVSDFPIRRTEIHRPVMASLYLSHEQWLSAVWAGHIRPHHEILKGVVGGDYMSTGLAVIPLGKLEKVRVRDAWPDEARNFTPWLATEGLALLSEEIGVELKIIKCEHAVGRYSLDILASPAGGDADQDEAQLVVIENQFGSTDHDHLGKLMTYASGVGNMTQGAKTVIWIAEDFREEHQRALEWLNEVTQNGVRFYGMQLELYRIGESQAAPSFNVLVRPNEVVRARREVAAQNGESDRALFYIEYWTAFKEYCTNHNALFSLQTPRPDHYLVAALGRSGVHINFISARRDKWIGCELYINDADPAATLAALRIDQHTIDAAIPGLEWIHKSGMKSAKIHVHELLAPDDRALWANQHAWLLEQGNKFYSTFAARLRALR